MTRINDLGGLVKTENQAGREIVKDPVDYVKADLDLQEKGIKILYYSLTELKDDPTTYELLKEYLADEEEDLYWSKGQLEIIDMIGRQNWLAKQL